MDLRIPDFDERDESEPIFDGSRFWIALAVLAGAALWLVAACAALLFC